MFALKKKKNLLNRMPKSSIRNRFLDCSPRNVSVFFTDASLFLLWNLYIKTPSNCFPNSLSYKPKIRWKCCIQGWCEGYNLPKNQDVKHVHNQKNRSCFTYDWNKEYNVNHWESAFSSTWDLCVFPVLAWFSKQLSQGLSLFFNTSL